jgi:hypothetical protein
MYQNANIDSLSMKDGKIELKLSSSSNKNAKETKLLCDHLIVDIGAEPSMDLIQKSALSIDQVILDTLLLQFTGWKGKGKMKNIMIIMRMMKEKKMMRMIRMMKKKIMMAEDEGEEKK